MRQVKTAVQFGAGNIGRGFTGELFSESGFDVVFVDVVPEVVDGLNSRHKYTIEIASDPQDVIVVENVRAVNGREKAAVAGEVAQCEVACTAVGVNVLATVAEPIALGLALRRQARPDDTLNIIVCENMRDAAGALREMVLGHCSSDLAKWAGEHIGFAQAVVGRMVPVRADEDRRRDPLGIRVEAYKRLPVDADALKGRLPHILGVQPRNNFQAYIDQKLFAHNAGHAVSAYFGALKGLKYIWECMEDTWVRGQTEAVMTETGRALISRYHLDPDEHWAHVQDLLIRFGNAKLGDTVARVGGDPLRKLGRDDRLIGAALFCLEQGVYPGHLASAVAAALHYNNPADPSAVRMQALIAEKGIASALEEISGIGSESEIGKNVVLEYESIVGAVA